MILTLIRHGQTDLGYQRKYCGSLDVSLNDDGRDQSEKLSGRFKALAFDSIYSSDLKRALQTAQIAFKNEKIFERPCFREMDFGILEGFSYEEAISKCPEIYKAWINDPWSVTLPQGESFSNFHARTMQGLETLLTQHKDKSIALVSHSGPIRVILCEALGLNFKEFWSIHQDNTAVNIIEYHPSHKPKVIVLNDTGHLKLALDLSL